MFIKTSLYQKQKNAFLLPCCCQSSNLTANLQPLIARAQVYQRFVRWSNQGYFKTLFLVLQEHDHQVREKPWGLARDRERADAVGILMGRLLLFNVLPKHVYRCTTAA